LLASSGDKVVSVAAAMLRRNSPRGTLWALGRRRQGPGCERLSGGVPVSRGGRVLRCDASLPGSRGQGDQARLLPFSPRIPGSLPIVAAAAGGPRLRTPIP